MKTSIKNKLPASVLNLEPKHHKKTWILIAQRTRAKLLEPEEPNKKFKTLEGFVNPEGELLTRELTSDKAGRAYHQGEGMGRYVMDNSEDAHEQALLTFSKKLADTLENGLAKGDCNEIILVAEPHCLGRIKKALKAKNLARVKATINKDLFLLDDKKLYAKLESVLA